MKSLRGHKSSGGGTPYNPADLQALVAAAAPIGVELRFKPMFGGIGVYADGRMCMTLSDAGVALKLGGAARETLLRLPGAAPLRYDPDGPPSKSYVVVPSSILADRVLLRQWIGTSAAFVKSAPVKPKRRQA